MPRFLKIIRLSFLLFIATSAVAQSAFDPYTPGHLPKLLLTWQYLGGAPDGTCGDTNAKPKFITSSTDFSVIDNLCDTIAGAEKPNRLLACFAGTHARNVRNGMRAGCKENFRREVKKLKNECDYITAYKYAADFGGNNNANINNIMRKTMDCSIAPAGVGGGGCQEVGCSGGRYNTCAINVFGIKFVYHKAQPGGDCVMHDVNLDKKQCPQCYEDRGQYIDGNSSGRSENEKRDPMRNTDLAEANSNGGYILSQGCYVQKNKNAIQTLGSSGLNVDLGSVLSGGISNVLNIFLPKCLMIPDLTGAEFDKFENYNVATSNQKEDVYNKIDETYNKTIAVKDVPNPGNTSENMKGQLNPYKGNCGRGKFFYRNLSAKDSNINGRNDTEFRAIRSETNDIWESKTGCYNPEERFVLFPAGKADYDVKTKQFEFYDPPLVQRLFSNLTLESATTMATNPKLLKEAKKWALSVLEQNVSDEKTPWDELDCSDNNAPCVKTTDPATKLIPNDRLLMRHPLCQKLYNETISDLTDLNAYASAIVSKINSSKTMFRPGDIAKIKEDGSLPVCFGDDKLDEVMSFCGGYLEATNRSTQFAGVNLPINTEKNYSVNRYVFDYTTSCWKKEWNPHFLSIDPDERWMPLAIKVNPGTGTFTRKDPFNIDQTFHVTDYKRSNFTKYSERQLADKGLNPTDHKLVSLEEYGYRGTPISRSDYTYNPFNIYAPDATDPLTRLDVDKLESQGRKAKMQKCISLYLEKWAFEGDKGAIVLDSSLKAKRYETNSVTPDASMCQWVAYYDTSENYGDDEDYNDPLKWKQRNAQKAVMLSYFNAVQTINQKYRGQLKDEGKKPDNYSIGFLGSKFTIPILNISVPLMGITTSPNTTIVSPVGPFPGQDPERLKSKSTNDPKTLVDPLPGGIAGGIFGKPLANMNDHGFNRRRGMRPEIFDYYNFLSFSAVGVAPEGLDLTNGTTVGDGNPMPEGLKSANSIIAGDGSNLPSSVTSNQAYQTIVTAIDPVKKVMGEELYTPVVSSTGSLPTSLDELRDFGGHQVNMERRNCNSVVPPHFWKDSIKPFGACDFKMGAANVNNIAYSLSRNGGLANTVAGYISGLLNGTYTHWMTTNINQDVTSLLTPRPMLPVVAYGINFENIVYFKTNWEKFVFPQTNSEGSPFYVYDTWIGRSGGRPVLGKNLVDDPWVDSDGKLLNGVDDDDEDDLRDIYSDNDYGNYDDWSEVPMNVSASSGKLGMIVIDETSKASSREWVDHTWNPRTCMHNEPLDILKLTVGTPLLNPVGLIDQVIENAKDTNSSKKVKLSIYSTIVNPSAEDVRNRKFVELDPNDVKNQDIQDAWRVKDDISIARVPLFYAPDKASSGSSGGTGSNYLDNKQMGGFKVKETDQNNKFEWLPHAWSLAVGFNKAFWCEFEVPYNPYFKGSDDFRFNKTPIASHFPINGIKNLISPITPKPLSDEYKPRLQHYRVERIRDTCGPFGVRSTWIDDPDNLLGKWLIGYYDENDPYRSSKGDKKNDTISKSRCAGWLDIYKKGVTDPKIISWRLPRFDYEFLKSFLECTGPIKTVGPSPCKFNKKAWNLNKKHANCEFGMAAANLVKYVCYNIQYCRTYVGLTDDDAVECWYSGCEKDGCHKEDQNEGQGEEWSALNKFIDNTLRGLDYITRGDTYYGMEEKLRDDVDNVYSDPIYGLEGFREPTKHSTSIQKFWLQKGNGDFYNDNDPFGFWCNCPSDDLDTTRCREDFCTTEQHVLLVGRKNIKNSTIAISSAPGPFGRWLSCYYQARARSCPILTREVSDTPAYSTLVDPFPQDKTLVPGITEATSAGQNFNVCDATKPTGIGSEKMDQFLRWMHEEPNHLARVPLWFESAGGGYKNQDFVFYTQTRDFEPPFMEMAAPFPIDLITRDAESKNDRDINALGEINQREGTSDMAYKNPEPTGKNEIGLKKKYEAGFLSAFLPKMNTAQIRPTEDASYKYLDSKKYTDVYTKYLKGLYSVSKGYNHGTQYRPTEPGMPDTSPDLLNRYTNTQDSNYRIDPRAQDTIVGPRGCDIGGWYEMMLYQARCIKFFALNCICDYDKTFARGNAVTYALKKAGMTFKSVASPNYADSGDSSQYLTDQHGDVILEREHGYENISGQLHDAEFVETVFGGAVRYISSSFANLKKVFVSRFDMKGRKVGSGIAGIKISTKDVSFPLADRGVVGPEFATPNIQVDESKFISTGLDDVMVGDLIIWDESISANFNDKAIDAGYQRHIAYVEKVDRGPKKSVKNASVYKKGYVPQVIKVSEMNWGKDLDSCGNTDMWGRGSERTIFSPNYKPQPGTLHTTTTYSGINGIIFVPLLTESMVKPKAPLEKYASCQNADWAVCVEKYWNQVKIYRPYKVKVEKDADMCATKVEVEQDPQYKNPICMQSTSPTSKFPKKIDKARFFEIAQGTKDGNGNIIPGTTVTLDIMKSFYQSISVSDSSLTFTVENVQRYLKDRIRQNKIDETGKRFVITVMNSDLWKLLAPLGSYPYDEVNEFLYNPLSGVLDVCDPPVINSVRDGKLRDNFDDVRLDAIAKEGAIECYTKPTLGTVDDDGGGGGVGGGGGDCPSGQIPDSDTGDCVCDPNDVSTDCENHLCPAGQTWDPVTEKCVDDGNINECGPDQIPDYNDERQCVDCPLGATVNGTTCDCPSGETYDAPSNTCSEIANECPGINQIPDPNEPSLCITCPSDSRANGTTCECDDAQETYDPDRNVCEREIVTACPGVNQIPDPNNAGQCIDCPSGSTANGSTCDCGPDADLSYGPPPMCKCLNNGTFDPNTQTCSTRGTDCAGNTYPDPNDPNACITCPNGSTTTGSSCDCGTEATYVPGSPKGTCKCNNSGTFDPANQTCSAAVVCNGPHSHINSLGTACECDQDGYQPINGDPSQGCACMGDLIDTGNSCTCVGFPNSTGVPLPDNSCECYSGYYKENPPYGPCVCKKGPFGECVID